MEMKHKEFGLTLNNWDKFKMAEFERKHYSEHIGRIKKSIMENGLLNKNITVWESNGNYHIIDGQHRLLALYSLLLEGFKRSYHIILNICPGKDEREARDIYIEINTLNKGTVGKDILKAYILDNPTFFNGLNGYCSHYGSTKDLAYLDVLYAIVYAKTEKYHMKKESIADDLMKVSKDEIERANQVIDSMSQIISADRRHWAYRLAVFRNIFRIYWNKYPDIIPKMHRFLKVVANDKYLETNSRNRGSEAMNMSYEYMNKLV